MKKERNADQDISADHAYRREIEEALQRARKAAKEKGKAAPVAVDAGGVPAGALGKMVAKAGKRDKGKLAPTGEERRDRDKGKGKERRDKGKDRDVAVGAGGEVAGAGGGGGPARRAVADALGKMHISFTIPYRDLTLGREIGRGSFGIVRKGRLQYTDVAVKELLVPRMTKEALQEFKQETQIMYQLRHPNIVPLYGVCLEPGHYSMVMEYMPKGSLYNVLHNGARLTWKTRWQMAIEIGKGILHLHCHKPPILHCDLKSLNVLVNKEDHVGLTDFGLSKVKTETLASTRSSQAVGTLPWMAPELFEPGARYTEASDVYSFAIILLELATQKTPWENAHGVGALIIKWVTDGQREAIPADCPPSYAALIARCWDGRADRRPTIEAAVQELEAHKVDVGLRT